MIKNLKFGGGFDGFCILKKERKIDEFLSDFDLIFLAAAPPSVIL